LLATAGEVPPDEKEFEAIFRSSFNAKFGDEKSLTGVAEWAAHSGKEFGKLKSAPSKIGIAREYATKLLEMNDAQFKLDQRPRTLLEWIKENLSLPALNSSKKVILEPDES
jgi:hypothetical protein